MSDRGAGMMGLTGIADGETLAHPGGLVAVAANHDGDPNVPMLPASWAAPPACRANGAYRYRHANRDTPLRPEIPSPETRRSKCDLKERYRTVY
ncbi:hypothetical protein [Mycobacterium marinum]|uniref:PPW family C-terminal domain-containing PPE protein n=1 Tax=Mycobacterium marinum TaxID=1781 RepID=UPI0021C38195|nr:hypothetical protein [Mycobacterium marinum]